MIENLTSFYNELNALYNCYIVLSESSLEKETSKAGMMVIYERMVEILRHVDVFPIIAKNNPNVLEDYIYNVKNDTLEFLSLIRDCLSK